MNRGVGSIALLFAAALSSLAPACRQHSPNHALLGRCEPEVDAFAPSVAWVSPPGTQRKPSTLPSERPLEERDLWAEYMADHHGIAPLPEVVLPEGTSEIRVFFPGCVLRGVLISRAGDEFVAAGLVSFNELIALEPVGTWPELWDQLVAEGLLTLPDQREFGPAPIFIHGTVYTVEINRGGAYRRYEWDVPHRRSEPQAQAVVRIARILRENLRAQWTL